MEIAYKESQTELSQLKNDIMAGRYLESDYVESELSRFFIVLKRAVLSLPRVVASEIAPMLDPLDVGRIEKRLTERLTDALEQMSIGGVYSARKTKRTKTS